VDVAVDEQDVSRIVHVHEHVHGHDEIRTVTSVTPPQVLEYPCKSHMRHPLSAGTNLYAG
jgi:hypothetical protein